MRPSHKAAELRVVIETLNQSRDGSAVNIDAVASRARTSKAFAREVLDNLGGLENSATMNLSRATRLRLAIQAAKAGGLREVARALTWQEFEEFAEECLYAAGFITSRGLIVKGEDRKWQIDLIARKGQLVLLLDCKHWTSPGYPSKFKSAGNHQKLAALALIHDVKIRASLGDEKIEVLPVILTTLEPHSQLSDGVVLVSLEKLADFLSGVTPFSRELPFISEEALLKNPI